ncbi:hypothetical protein [Ktedonobacter racemifer]|uniref:hypothetical protein n=1 Tax=Ktedonobacter racemifer TaxID=363277 RepID=UPI0012FBAF47|nr:hypothetical protein [Ktedonobacter racemifer]
MATARQTVTPAPFAGDPQRGSETAAGAESADPPRRGAATGLPPGRLTPDSHPPTRRPVEGPTTHAPPRK